MSGIFKSINKTICPIHKEGYPFIIISLVLTVILTALWSPFGWIGTIITIWICYFFRDPERVTIQDDNLVISPADGRISLITKAVPPEELDLPKEPMTRISVFMNVFDCHVNRSPVSGKIHQIRYTPGVFLNAELDKASDENERSGYVVQTENHGKIAFVQIAGLVARRIVCFAQEGQLLNRGQRFGLIRFGSRVDVYLPDNVKVLVGIGQRTIAGETVLASFLNDETEMSFKAS